MKGDASTELVRLVSVFWQAEQGKCAINRLMLSGHSDGDSLWGDDNGRIEWSAFAQLVALFPRARAEVHDLFIGACNNGWQTSVKRFIAMFPQLQSLWAYVKTAPSVATGGARDMQSWAHATEPGGSGLSRGVASHSPVADRVAIWTKHGGYSPPAGADSSDLEVERLLRGDWPFAPRLPRWRRHRFPIPT